MLLRLNISPSSDNPAGVKLSLKWEKFPKGEFIDHKMWRWKESIQSSIPSLCQFRITPHDVFNITAFLIKKKKEKNGRETPKNGLRAFLWKTVWFLDLILVSPFALCRWVQHVPGWRVNQYFPEGLFHHLQHSTTGKILPVTGLHLYFLNCIQFLLPLHETEELFFHDSILCGYGLANLECATKSPLFQISHAEWDTPLLK